MKILGFPYKIIPTFLSDGNYIMYEKALFKSLVMRGKKNTKFKLRKQHNHSEEKHKAE
jgi:hypothetical protein